MSSVWIGFDPRPAEAIAFAVARQSVRRFLTPRCIPIYGVVLAHLREQGLYTRPTETRIGTWEGSDGRKWSSTEPVLWDVISQWPMSTEFAISRFLVPELVKRFKPNSRLPGNGWALFVDGDVLVRSNLSRLFDYDSESQKFAVRVVQHNHNPVLGTKMDGQIQTQYSRKNWSSVMLFNCDHPANDRLTLEMINSVPGRDLHRFCWLEDHEIGALDPAWNYLVGESDQEGEPKLVHFTAGVPCLPGRETVEYADEWRQRMCEWAR